MPSPLDDATFSHTLPGVPRRESDASETGRRRSSASSGGRFSSLNYQKRQGSGDPEAIARRESYNDQRRESGWLGGLWNKYVMSHYFLSIGNSKMMMQHWNGKTEAD